MAVITKRLTTRMQCLDNNQAGKSASVFSLIMCMLVNYSYAQVKESYTAPSTSFVDQVVKKLESITSFDLNYTLQEQSAYSYFIDTTSYELQVCFVDNRDSFAFILKRLSDSSCWMYNGTAFYEVNSGEKKLKVHPFGFERSLSWIYHRTFQPFVNAGYYLVQFFNRAERMLTKDTLVNGIQYRSIYFNASQPVIEDTSRKNMSAEYRYRISDSLLTFYNVRSTVHGEQNFTKSELRYANINYTSYKDFLLAIDSTINKYESVYTVIQNTGPSAPEQSTSLPVSYDSKLLTSTLPTSNGDSINLSKLTNTIKILNFWYPGCQYCHKEFPELIKLYNTLKGTDVHIFGVDFITYDTKATLKAIKYYGLPYPTIMGKQYRPLLGSITGFPTTVILDRENRLYRSVVGHPPDFAKTILTIVEELRNKEK